MGTRSLIFMAGLSLLAATAPAATTWTGDAGDGDWNNVNNWSNGVPVRAQLPTSDTAHFGPDVTGGSIDWLGGNSRPKNVHFNFLAGAPAFTFVGAASIDNAGGNPTFVTQSGVTTDQTFTWSHVANFAITLNGSGDMSFGTLTGNNTWNETNVNTLPIAVNDAAAALNIGAFNQQRPYAITKSGPGKLAVTGQFDIVYGVRDSNSDFIISTIKTSGSAGTIDLSAATAVFETQMDVGEALEDGEKYTVVDYANATLIGNALTGFGSVAGVLPEGWGLRNNAADSKIYLQQIPEPAAVAPVAAIVAGLLRRRRRR